MPKLQRPKTIRDYPTRPIREFTIKMGMETEMLHGMRLTGKAPPANAIVYNEYGCRGSRPKRYMQFCEMTDQIPDPRIVELLNKEKK